MHAIYTEKRRGVVGHFVGLLLTYYISLYILTGMEKLLVVLDDETANLLRNKKNKSAFVRESVKYMSMDMTPDTIEGLRVSYNQLAVKIKDMDSKLDFIAARVQ